MPPKSTWWETGIHAFYQKSYTDAIGPAAPGGGWDTALLVGYPGVTNFKLMMRVSVTTVKYTVTASYPYQNPGGVDINGHTVPPSWAWNTTHTTTSETRTYDKTPDKVCFVYKKRQSVPIASRNNHFRSVQMSADFYMDMIAVAWVSQTPLKPLYVAWCPAARKQTFEAAQLIEPMGADEIGLSYLPNGRCYLSYTLVDTNGHKTKYWRYSDGYGRGGCQDAS